MFFSETRIAANPPGAVPLSRDQIWQGLEQKAFDAVPYVEAITECRVIDRKSESVFDREATIGGHRYVERVWLEPPNRIAFTRTQDGTANLWTVVVASRSFTQLTSTTSKLGYVTPAWQPT